MHAKYQCSINKTLEDISQVKVFVTDGRTEGWMDELVLMSPAFAKERGTIMGLSHLYHGVCVQPCITTIGT